MVKAWGYASQQNGRIVQTDKAIRVTIRELNGETAHVDTMWIAKSICQNLDVTEHKEEGVTHFEFTASLPKWWTRKLDTRPGWAKRGEQSPYGQRPW